MKEGKFYRYPAHSRAFLDRARDAIAAFKSDHDVQQLLIGALMLRLGIEARLFEYIGAELPSEGRQEQLARIADFQATKLLSRLASMNADAKVEVLLTITPSDGGNATGLRYTPVTDSLARIHGQLGNLLHFNYFTKNPYWYIADRLSAPGLPTVVHAQDLVERGIEELAEATSGSLLSHPQFRAVVNELVQEDEVDADE